MAEKFEAILTLMKSAVVFTLVFFAALTAVSGFPGWQGLRVIKVPNGAYKMQPIRLEAEGGESLMLVETRQSRLVFYQYVGSEESGASEDFSENPNYLPMAEDFRRTEYPMTRLPQVASVYDVDDDGIDEIFVVQADPRKLVVLKKSEAEWKMIKEWEISDSELSSSGPVLVRKYGDAMQILVSFTDGIQVIDYATEKEVNWLQPRERDIERNRWWLIDFDQDGDLDVVEGQNAVTSPVRWYEADGADLRPAANISEDIGNTNVARLIRSSSGPQIVFLGSNQTNTVSYYKLGEGEESKYGHRNLLPLSQASSNAWASIELEGKQSIVELGRNKPLINLYERSGEYWSFIKAYPILQDVEKMKAIRDTRNSILLWVKGEGEMYESHWEAGRFSFPKKLENGGVDASEWKIIAFDQYGSSTWWVQQRGKELVLNVWDQSQAQVKETVFPGISGEYEECVWLGGETLLVKKKFAKGADLCRLIGGKSVITTSRFSAADIQKIKYDKGSLYILADGFVQKLADDLEVQDQIMLDGDYSIRSFAPISETEAYALETNGERLHMMRADESGIFQTVEKHTVPYTLEIALDPVLGLTLVGSTSINVPTQGTSEQLVHVSTVDPNEGNIREYDQKSIGTMFVVDLEGDGIDELATVDYGQKEIVIYGEADGTIKDVISWKVYDDGKYPYGQDTSQRVGMNPYRMESMDIDGDSLQDMVLASHDRIIVYLAKDNES